MKPTYYDEILFESDYGVIFKHADTIIFESKYENKGKKYPLRFNVLWLPPDRYEWFCHVCGKTYHENMQDIQGQTEINKQQEIKTILGL